MTETFGRFKRLYNLDDDINGIDPVHVRSIGGRYWKNLATKQTYIQKASGILQDRTDDLPLGGRNRHGFEFQNNIVGFVREYIRDVKSVTTDEYFKSRALGIGNTLPEKINVPKSVMYVSNLMTTLNSYIQKSSVREAHDVHPEAIKIYQKHLNVVSSGATLLEKLPADQQEEMIISGLEPGSNLGYSFFSATSKRTFGAQFRKHCKSVGLGDVDLTIQGILSACEKAVSIGYAPPFMLFFRTHTPEKTRCVFGADMLGKAISGLIQACKKLAKDEGLSYPMWGSVPWIAWDPWDPMFDNWAKIVEQYQDNTVMGEDFAGWDQSLRYDDFTFIERLNFKLKPAYRWINLLLEKSDVWVGPHRIKDVFFKSGHPLTSEYGSLMHMSLTFHASDHHGVKALHSTVLSDDNLTVWDGFVDVREHVNFLEGLGFVVSQEKTSLLSRDKFVVFLKNHIGYIQNDAKMSFIGDPISRYYGLAHVERVGDTRGLWEITRDDGPTDQIISKLGTFTSGMSLPVTNILRRASSTKFGRDAINGINLMRQMNIDPVLAREDLSISFTPKWLKELELGP